MLIRFSPVEGKLSNADGDVWPVLLGLAAQQLPGTDRIEESVQPISDGVPDGKHMLEYNNYPKPVHRPVQVRQGSS
jgi:hypothetical protein